MATTGNLITWTNLTDNCGDEVTYRNPGSSGTSYYICCPCFTLQMITQARSSIFVAQTRMTFSIWYYTGNPGSNGESNRVPVVEGRTIEGTSIYTLHHNFNPGSADKDVDGKYNLFRVDAIRNQGEGERTQVYFHPTAISQMPESTYNTHFRNRHIYGIANTEPYLISGRGWSNSVLTHFNLTSKSGTIIDSTTAKFITNGRWDYGV